MANKSLFASLKSRFVRADTVNEAGGRAYSLEPKHALAQAGCHRLLQWHVLRGGRPAVGHAEDPH